MTNENNTNMELKLLKEAIWNIEDKLNVVLESITEHETEFIALKQLTQQCLERLSIIEKKEEKKSNELRNR